MRTKDEIDELRREARELLKKAARAYRLRPLAERKLEALQAAMTAVATYAAAEKGVSLDDMSLDEALATDDERALVRLVAVAGGQAGGKPEIPVTDTHDHVVARLAAEKGWSITDAARAILGAADVKVDKVRNTAPHAKARRVHDAVQQVLRQRVDMLDGQLAALRAGRPMEAGPILVAAAVMSFVLGREIPFELIEPTLQAERDRLAKLLKG